MKSGKIQFVYVYNSSAPHAADIYHPHPHPRTNNNSNNKLESDTEWLEEDEGSSGSGGGGNKASNNNINNTNNNDNMAVRKKQDDKFLLALRELVNSSPGNRQCFDCSQKGPTYVNMTIGSFVCTRCSGVL